MRLTTRVHDRDSAGLTYVYPVVSRRAGGVSVGVNLNPNNACNWRCVYCQVPGLVYGKGPPIDLGLLSEELSTMLTALTEGDYMERHVPPDARRLNDVAISGNGEPTSSPDFEAAVRTIVEVLDERGLCAEAEREVHVTAFTERPGLWRFVVVPHDYVFCTVGGSLLRCEPYRISADERLPAGRCGPAIRTIVGIAQQDLDILRGHAQLLRRAGGEHARQVLPHLG